MSAATSSLTAATQAVLVCGLGRVGRQCIKALRGYHVPVRAIDLRSAPDARAELEEDEFTQGDFRELDTLRAAGIHVCRAIVLLSSDPAVNVEGALAARRVNPDIRLVVRAQEHSWHTLLAKQLGNLVVYEPNRLSAAAFAFAALDSDVLAHFYVEDNLFQVFEHEVPPGDPWVGQAVETIHPLGRQVLLHMPHDSSGNDAFYGWKPQQTIAAGDRLLLLSKGNPINTFTTRISARPRRRGARRLFPKLMAARARLRPDLFSLRRRKRLDRPARVALTGLGTLAGLLLVATTSFSLGDMQLPFAEAFRLAVMLLTGGHLADVYTNFDELPKSLHWMEIVLVVSGTLLTAVLYALLTDLLLKARFELLARRPSPPQSDHVIVAGLGDTGERIASLLETLRCKVVAVEKGAVDQDTLPTLPVVAGSATEANVLREANIGLARGLIAATADDQRNVEIALLASNLNPNCRIAVRTFDPRFSENVAFLLPHARVLCVSSLAATAYAAAALGEHVIHLFQTPQSPVLVVEYNVSRGDTLIGRPLWQVAEGYSVVPVLHRAVGAAAHVPGPEEFVLQLREGDQLIVLATANSLEAIERADLRTPEYELWLERLRPYAESLQVVGTLSQRLGYTLEQARTVLATLPQRVPMRLYGLYATRTARILNANGVETKLQRVSRSGRVEVEAPQPQLIG